MDHLSEFRQILYLFRHVLDAAIAATHLNGCLELFQSIANGIRLMHNLKDSITNRGLIEEVIDRHVDGNERMFVNKKYFGWFAGCGARFSQNLRFSVVVNDG